MQFNEFFNEKLREKNISLKKLEEATGIPRKYLDAISAGDFEALPAAPYVHGYLASLGKLLDFNGDDWWEEFKRERAAGHVSGSRDILPQNRFALRSFRRLITGGVVILAILLYVVFRFSHIAGMPSLTISSPSANGVSVSQENFVIAGKTGNANKVVINNEQVPMDASGVFQKQVQLHSGLNTFEIVASKFLGGQSKTVLQIFYQAPATSSPTIIPPAGPSSTTSTSPNKATGTKSTSSSL